VFHVVFPLSVIELLALRVVQNAGPRDAVLDKVAFVFGLVEKGQPSFAVPEALAVMSLEEQAVSPLLFAKAVLLVELPVALEDGAVSFDEDAFAVGLVVGPKAFVEVS
jgi:hypothetical protein